MYAAIIDLLATTSLCTFLDYLPVYFQAVKGASPIQSGVDVLLFALMIAVSALASGIIVQKQKKYIPVNVAGWMLMVVGFGVLSLMKADSTQSQWLGYQVLCAVGIGLLVSPAYVSSFNSD